MLLFPSHMKLGLASADLHGGNFPVKGSLENAKEILSGNLVVDNWIKDEVPFALRTFDWGGVYGKSPTTFQLYLQGLKPVLYLVGAYELTQDKAFFSLALDMLKSWLRYEKGDASLDNTYVWDQHAAALRTENILCLLVIGLERNRLSSRLSERIRKVLLAHGVFLADRANYLPGENHGVFQDRALLCLGYALNIDEWVEVAVSRAFEQWDALFDSDMACVENSFLYQRVNKDLFVDIAYLLSRKGRKEGIDLRNRMARAEDFMGYALMPNGICPPYGDTLRDDYSSCAFVDANDVLVYSSRGGKEGVRPPHTSVAYPCTGLFFAREHWGQPDGEFPDAVWAMFRSGYSSITHRQADDNHFMLYARGHEVFTDASIYNYMYRHPMRQHVRSALAHNTLVVDGKSYDFLQVDNKDLAGFVNVELGDGDAPDYIVGFNSLHFGVVHIRHFIYWKTVLVIVDEAWSRVPHTYSQLFYCGADMVVGDCSVERVILDFPDEHSSHVEVLQLCESGKAAFQAIKGSEEAFAAGMVYGAIGGDFNEALYTTVLKYDRTVAQSSGPLFATAVKVVDDGAPLPQCDVDVSSRSVIISLDESRRSRIGLKRLDPADLAPAPKYAFDCISVFQDGSRFRFEYTDPLPEGVECAWYVHGNYGKSTLYKGAYSSSRHFDFDLSEVKDDHCAVRLFLYQKQGKLKGSQCVVAVDRVSDEWTWRYWQDWEPDWKSWFGGTSVSGTVKD